MEKLPFALSPERLRRRLRDRVDRDGEEAAERLFATALAARLPAAWALFYDVTRGPVHAWLAAFTDRDDRVDEAIETVVARVRTECRLDRGESLRIPAPHFLEWLKLSCLIELAGEAAEVDASPLSLLATPLKGCFTPRDLVASTALTSHAASCPRCSTALQLIRSDGSTSLVELLLEEPATSEQVLTHGPAIHLPSAITALVLIIVLPWLAIGFDSDDAPQTDRGQARLIELLRKSEFDPALRNLGRTPPKGLENLRPSWPEERERRLQEIVRRGVPSTSPAILSPRGTVADSTPAIALSPELPAAPAELTIVDIDSGDVVYRTELTGTEREHTVATPLRDGRNYRVTLGGSRGASGREVSSNFRVAPRSEWLHVDAERERIREQLDTPTIQPFFDALLLRAAGYTELSLREWKTLATHFPGSSYPLEEAALALEDLHRDAEAWQLAISIEHCHAKRGDPSSGPSPAD